MNDDQIAESPKALQQIIEDTNTLGFDMASEPKTGSLLRILAASKPTGSFLELGTGTGLSGAWILDGMDDYSSLMSLDNDPEALSIANKNLGDDDRVLFECCDGIKWLENNQNRKFDFIFADAYPGKFEGLELALNILKVGGFYIIDDLLPQQNWPDGHAPKVPELIAKLESLNNFKPLRMAWASGLMILVRFK